MYVARPSVQVNLAPYFKGEEQDARAKSLFVCHETVSYNVHGLTDIAGVAKYMDSVNYEIHGIIDMEGNSGWCYDPLGVYDHCASNGGMVNTRSIGFELVSEVPFMKTLALKREAWDPEGPRKKQLDKLARWVAWLHKKQGIPLTYSDGTRPGITTHWSVSQSYNVPGGHTDCWPLQKGGYFPVNYVIYKARQIVKEGTKQ
jgi:hypothetical protein